MSKYRCFWLEPTDLFVHLAHYGSAADKICDGTRHRSEKFRIGVTGFYGETRSEILSYEGLPKHNCLKCGYEFQIGDFLIETKRPAFKRSDDGKFIELENSPVGAMWDATWHRYRKEMCGSDGRSICVQTPHGVWVIDARSSNCSKPDLDHKCWTRDGEVPDLNVTKSSANCMVGSENLLNHFHGFIRKGWLTEL